MAKWLESHAEKEVRLTQSAIGKGIAPKIIQIASQELLNNCIKELEELDKNTKYYPHEKAERKQEIYDIMKKIREANTGKIERTCWESLQRKKDSILLPENIKGNLKLLAGCVLVSSIALALVLPVLALTGPLGPFMALGAVAAIAIASAALYGVCKLLSACFKALFNWGTGANKQAASKQAEAASHEMMAVYNKKGLRTMTRSPAARTYSVADTTSKSGGKGKAANEEIELTAWDKYKKK